MTTQNVSATLQVGDRLVAARQFHISTTMGYNRRLPEGAEVVVAKPGGKSALLRYTAGAFSFWVEKSYYIDELHGDENLPFLRPAGEDYVPPRRLGEVPTEGDVLSPADPRLDWFWQDMATYADKKGYCAQYDSIVAAFGVPGRPRDFTVRRDLGGLVVTTTVRARSQVEADAMVDAALKSA